MDKRIPNAAIRRVWLDATLTSAEAARRLGLSRVRLWVRAKSMGLPARRSGRPEVIPAVELRVLWPANVKVSEIAVLYQCPRNSVRQAARRLGLPGRPKGKHAPITLADFRLQLVRRANQPTARLTEAEKLLLQKVTR